MPNYLISYSDHKVVLRNYEGYITTYEEPVDYQPHDRGACAWCRSDRTDRAQSGVHGLLQGDRMWIEPAGFAQVHARGNTEQHRLQDPSKWVPYGVGAIEGSAGAVLPVLPAGESAPAARTTGNGGRTWGPGEEPRPREGEPTGSAHGELL
jgi:hypothetical protein